MPPIDPNETSTADQLEANEIAEATKDVPSTIVDPPKRVPNAPLPRRSIPIDPNRMPPGMVAARDPDFAREVVGPRPVTLDDFPLNTAQKIAATNIVVHGSSVANLLHDGLQLAAEEMPPALHGVLSVIVGLLRRIPENALLPDVPPHVIDPRTGAPKV